MPVSYAQTPTPAMVVKVSAPDGFYKFGATVPITVEFSEAVTVTGRPSIIIVDIEADDSAATVRYDSGSGTTMLVFPYSVRRGTETRDLRYHNTVSLLVGGTNTIRVGTLDANVTLPDIGSPKSLSGFSAVVLDHTAPMFPAPGDATTGSAPLVRTIAIGSTTATEVYNAEAIDFAGTADTGITYAKSGTHEARFSLDTLTGVLTPAATESNEATYTLTLTATDQAGNVGTQYLRVEVLPATPTFRTTISNQSYPAKRDIQPLTLPQAFGGTGALSYALTPPPTGLDFNSADRILSGMPNTPTGATALTYTVSDSADPPNTAALTFSVTITAALPPPPISQTVSANYTFAPTGTNGVSAGGSFRLLFVTTQTTDATSPEIDTYNTVVQTSATSAGGGHSAIQDFSSQFRALISTDTVAARDNTATNRDTGTDTNAPIYWLGSNDRVAADYDDFYDGGWSFSTDGTDQNGGTYTFATPGLPYIWTGSERDGTVGIDVDIDVDIGIGRVGAGSNVGGVKSTKIGRLMPNEELVTSVADGQTDSANIFPLYALSPILTLNQIPTVSTAIPDQTAPIGDTFTYRIPDDTFVDAGGGDAITYSASKSPDAAWLNFDPATSTFSGRPTAADVGSITITVTAFDGIDKVSTEFSVAAIPPPPEPQTVSANYTFAPSTVPADRKFRLLFVTTQTTAATDPDIGTYNTVVKNSAAGGHSAIQDFSDQFRALISTDTVAARDNTATNTDTGSDTDAPIYWLGGAQVAAGYATFYDGGWDNVVGTNQNGNTTTPNLIWTGSERDGTVGIDGNGVGRVGAGSSVGGAKSTKTGRLVLNEELVSSVALGQAEATNIFPLYALSPILTLNQAPTISTVIPDQTAPIGAAFDYRIPDGTFTDADSGDTLTYSASKSPDAAWLNFDPATSTFSGRPTAADVGFITITVTASDGIDSVTDEFTVAVPVPPSSGPPEPQTVSANYTFAPSGVSAGDSFRLLFVTTQTTAATDPDIGTYNTFVQTSAASSDDSDIRRFSNQFRALISTDTVAARDNTATNSDTNTDTASDPPGTDAEAPIYWLGSNNQVATGYGDFYDGGWSFSMAGTNQNGGTYTFATPSLPYIWTGSERDGTVGIDGGGGGRVGAGSSVGGEKSTKAGRLIQNEELVISDVDGQLEASFALPLYALSPILILNQLPTASADISDQTAPIGAAFTYPFPAFTDADSGDTITYSAEIPDAAWLTFNPVTLIFSGTPTADDAGVLTITVTASDDIDEGTAEFTVTVAGLTLTPTSLMLDEGTTTTYTAILTTQPTGPVTVTIDSSENTDLTILPPVLTFTRTTWDEAQTVTVTADEDDDATSEDATLPHIASGGSYDGVTANFVVSVTDNDSRGVMLSPPDVSLTEGATATYTARLTTEPTALVTVTIGPDGDVTPTPGILTFTRENWDIEQSVMLTAAEDLDAVQDVPELTHTANGGDYVDIKAVLRVTVEDNDEAGVTLSPDALEVDEGADTDTYSVVLDTQPTGAVTVEVTVDGNSDVTVMPDVLTFIPANWNSPQRVTVRVADNDVVGENDMATLTHSASGGDYAGVSAVLEVTVIDTDSAGLSMPVTLTVAEGGTAGYSVVLNTVPTALVTVTIGGDEDVTPTPGILTFTEGNWAVAQTVTLTDAGDDDARDDVAILMHTTASEDSDYAAVDIHRVLTVTVMDDDTEGLALTPTSLMLDEGTTTSYTAILTSKPSGQVTVTIGAVTVTIDDGGDGGDGDVTPTPGILTFTTESWNIAQTVTVTADEDDDATNGVAKLIHGITSKIDNGYIGLQDVKLSVTVMDDDSPGLALTPTSLMLDEGTTTTYTATLITKPTSLVTVTIVKDGNVTHTPGILTFTTENWNIAQTVTLTAGEDVDAMPGEARLTHTANGGDYTGIDVVVLVVTVMDDDIRGVTLSPAENTLAVDEGADTDTYTVVLDTLPTGEVTVEVTIVGNSDVTIMPSALTFTPGNWNSPQRVTVSVADNDVAGVNAEATLTHSASGGDYDGVSAVLVVTVNDNDSAGLSMPATLTVTEGGTATYSVVLNTLPTSSVTVRVAISEDSDVTATPTALIFTPDDWFMPQTVTVTAAEDADARQDVAMLTHTTDTSDTDYAAVDDRELTVTVRDDDIAGLTLSPETLTVVENTAATYSVVLNTPPTETVTVSVAISGDSDVTITITPTVLIFPPEKWDMPQTVTVTAAEDDDATNGVATLTHTIASISSGYIGLEAVALSVTVMDNDTAGLELSLATLTLSEGATASYTATLTSKPSGAVTVTIDDGDDGDVTPTPGILTFTTENWNIAQTVTLTAGEDDDTDTDEVTLTHTTASTDSVYDGITEKLLVTVTDNDTDTDTTLTTRLNEQILSRATSAMTAGTLAAVAARVDAAADGSGGSGKPLAFQLDGRSSLPGLLEKNGKAMLEDTMDYERLLDGASFVLPLSATDDASTGNTGKTAVWGNSDFRNLADDDADGLEWEGQTLSAHLGIDKRFSEQALAGLALSWNDASFDYKDDAGNSTASEGEYQYSVVTINPYFGWSNDGLKLWGSVGFGQGEITIDQEDGQEGSETLSTDTMSTDTTQRSFAGGFNRRLTDSPGGSLHIKGDVALTQVAVEAEAGKFDQQDIASSRLRLLLSSERRGELASGGALSPSLEVGVRSDGGDGTTGTGIEIGGGLRYANPGGTVAVAGNVRTLLVGDYDELGADFSVRLSSKSGRGLSLTLHPVWGRTQSVADRLWNEGASEITAGDITGGDTALRGSVDTEVGYGMPATMLGSPGVLTPYTGITAQDGGSSRLRLGGRFADGNGLSLNLEGTQKNTTDSASHRVLLRGEVAF